MNKIKIFTKHRNAKLTLGKLNFLVDVINGIN